MGVKASSMMAGGGFPLTELPKDVMIEVLCRVPDKHLIVNCRCVNTQWKDLIDDYSFWIRVARQNGVALPSQKLDLSIPELQRFVVNNNPIGRNLLKNWNAEEGLEHWTVHENGGHQFKIEEDGSGSQPVGETVPGVKYLWATSFGWCTKSQTVDLTANGLTGGFIDRAQPHIIASVWMAARFDCGCVYQMKVKLLDAQKNTVAEMSKERSEPQWGDNSWHKLSVTFTEYKPGVRYIKFLHRGKDTQFWAGHYGPKMAAPSVVLHIPD